MTCGKTGVATTASVWHIWQSPQLVLLGQWLGLTGVWAVVDAPEEVSSACP